MSAETLHPTGERLRAFVLNRLEDPDRAMVRNHLRFCAACLAAVRKLEATVAPILETNDRRADDTGRATKPMLDLNSTDPALELLAPDLLNHPRFQILGLLGTGGMGTVYRAADRLTHQCVALKVLQSFDAQSFHRFRREISLLGALDHPNLVPIFEASLAGTTPFIVMECVEGTSLDRLLLRKGVLHFNDASEIIRQAADALHHAHELKIVHRDVKPHNIMVTPTGQVKLLDWGLARVLEEAGSGDLRLTLTNQAVGTLEYIAPEQWNDSSSVDARADIFSLGGTLYMLLTGQPPLSNADVNQPMPVIGWTVELAARLGTQRPDVRPGLRRLLARMLDQDPKRRPSSAREVARTLEVFCVGADLAGLADDNRPYPAPRPHPRLGVVALCCLTLLLLVGVILAWLAWE